MDRPRLQIHNSFFCFRAKAGSSNRSDELSTFQRILYHIQLKRDGAPIPVARGRTTSIDASSAIAPPDDDVLFGKCWVNHHGNEQFRRVIDCIQDDYDKATKKGKTKKII